MWPLSAKAGIKKIRSYSKRKRLIEDVDGEADKEQLDLPALLPTRPVEIWMTAANIRALADRDPTMFSDPSIQLFKTTLQSVDLQLQKAHLITMEHAALQEKIRLEKRRKTTSRRSIYKGGGAEEVEVLWARKKARREKEQQIELRRAKRKLSVTVNKAISTLKSRGIQARKDEKARKERLISFEATGELAPVEDLFPVRQPDKDPTPDEAFFCTEKGYPELLLAIQQYQGEVDRDAILNDQIDPDLVDIVLSIPITRVQYPAEGYIDSSPPPPDHGYFDDSSDVESDAGSLDSITRNADFIEFQIFNKSD